MKTLIWILILLATAGSGVSLCQGTPSLTHEQQAWLDKANRHEKGGWIYLHIEGTPLERGFQYGYLLAPEIHESILSIAASWHYESAMEWSWIVQKAAEIFTPQIDQEYLSEMKGIAEGMKAAGFSATLDELVAYNSNIEIMGYWWPLVKDSISPNAAPPTKDRCSSFIATGSMTADGGVVLGHNTMSGYEYPLPNVILDILPDHGHRILMQVGAGFIHSGTDFFITDAGLVGSETTIGDFTAFDESGIPEFVRMRKATQYASSIDEWCDIMKKGNNGGYANAWLIGDIHTGEIARLELGLQCVALERKKDGYFIGSNVAEDLKLLRFETTTHETNIRLSSIARRVRWKQLMEDNKGKVNVQLAQQFEADHYDTYLEQVKPDSRTLCAHGDLDVDGQPPDFSPFNPDGTIDAKVVDTKMAGKMSFLARWGSACGTPFDAAAFLKQHPQFDWMNGILKDRPAETWVTFTAGETK